MTAFLSFRSLAVLVIPFCLLLGDLATTHAAPARPQSSKSASAKANKKQSSSAKKRIAILDLSGPKARAVRDALEDAAGEHYELISQKKYKSTAKRLKARKMRPRDVKKVANALELTAVIDGRVKKSKKHYRVRLTIHSGATGDKLEQVELKLPLKLNSKSRGEVRTQFAAVVSAMPSSAGEATEALAQNQKPPAAKEPPVAARGASGRAVAVNASSTGAKPSPSTNSKSKPAPAAAVEDDDTPYPIQVKFDERGQAIDDETPPMHKKR